MADTITFRPGTYGPAIESRAKRDGCTATTVILAALERYLADEDTMPLIEARKQLVARNAALLEIHARAERELVGAIEERARTKRKRAR
jgi:hypothetical protein